MKKTGCNALAFSTTCVTFVDIHGPELEYPEDEEELVNQLPGENQLNEVISMKNESTATFDMQPDLTNSELLQLIVHVRK